MSRTTPVEGSPKPREIVHGEDTVPAEPPKQATKSKKRATKAEE